MTTQAGPSISVVICTYNRYDVLPHAIQSCLDQRLENAGFEIIVVDNSPDPGTASAFAKRYEKLPNLSYLLTSTAGLSNARNVALAASCAELIAYLDDDAIASDGWLSEIVNTFERFGNSVAAGGRIVPIWPAERPNWIPQQKLGYLSIVDWGGETRVLDGSEWIAGANIAFRRSELHAVGGFDTRLGRRGPETSLLGNEENDVIRKLNARGGSVLYVPGAEVWHQIDPGRLHREWFRRRSAWQAVSDYLESPDIDRSKSGAFGDVLDFLFRQPPRYRSIAGLQADVDDPDLFNDQLDAVYNMTLAMLSGLGGVE